LVGPVVTLEPAMAKCVTARVPDTTRRREPNRLRPLKTNKFGELGMKNCRDFALVSGLVGAMGLAHAAEPAKACFYEHENYKGASFCTDEEQSWVGAAWNDRISSVKISSGLRVVMFEHSAFGGRSMVIDGDTRSLAAGRFNDLASSFKMLAMSLGGRAASIPVGIENVNDSPMKSEAYQTMIRFVPRVTNEVDRIYFGFKLRGANCLDAGKYGYGKGTGGTVKGTLVRIDATTGLPGEVIGSETVNGCARFEQAKQEISGQTPVLVWVNVASKLTAGTLYGLVLQNIDSAASANFFSVNLPLADLAASGPHARNELSGSASGALLSLDAREHVAWSADGGKRWKYGQDNRQYRSYMRDHDTAHPAVRMPQYGFRLAGGGFVAGQPYYAYGTTCSGCTVVYQKAIYAREFSELGGFTADNSGVGTLTIKNLDTGAEQSCAPAAGYGFGRCTLSSGVTVAAGESYSISTTGSVEVMEMDYSQRTLFPAVGSTAGTLRSIQRKPAPNTGEKDIPSLWAGPLSAFEAN
jgi:Peptidase inhibitor family I36